MLDLVFLSKELENIVIECSPSDELEVSFDHISLWKFLQIEPPTQVETESRLQWNKADCEKINQILIARMVDITQSSDHLSTIEVIHQQIEATIKAIQETITEMISKIKPFK